mgnify:CR=1 FL=1
MAVKAMAGRIDALLVIGGVFSLVGVIGMLRFPDFYMRLHAPTKSSTLGPL